MRFMKWRPTWGSKRGRFVRYKKRSSAFTRTTPWNRSVITKLLNEADRRAWNWGQSWTHLASVVKRVDSTIHWIINNYWARLSKISWFVRSIISRSRRPRQIDLRDTDKSRYFAITEFHNCFIVRSPFFWLTKYVKSLSACSGNHYTIFTQERSFSYVWAEYYLQENTHF